MYIYIYNICVFLSSLFIHHLRVRSLARIVRWWTWCIFGSVGTVETPHQIDRTWISLRQTEIWTSTLKTNSKKNTSHPWKLLMTLVGKILFFLNRKYIRHTSTGGCSSRGALRLHPKMPWKQKHFNLCSFSPTHTGKHEQQVVVVELHQPNACEKYMRKTVKLGSSAPQVIRGEH